MQIVLGVLSGVLGGFLYIFSSTTLRNSGAPIWTGAVAVLAGAVAFIYEKRGGIYWALLRTLLALAAFSTATAAIIIGAGRFYEYHFIFYKGICNVSPSWRPTGAPSPLSPDLERLQQCTTYVNMLKKRDLPLEETARTLLFSDPAIIFIRCPNIDSAM
ncbi:hypothetical protein MG293_006100 [Ovis ammon polii]|uniref:Transmembrane protein 176A n=1 Tax=Ovis ammon polii TaxID=230172 RepID=A0AAD4UC27_OVIAM|nr:hypothetical protein MG293_006100 [Ovis ammon polii]